MISALHSIGISTTAEELEKLGNDIYELKNSTRQKLGFSLENLEFPGRFFTTPSLSGPLQKEELLAMLEDYKVKCI